MLLFVLPIALAAAFFVTVLIQGLPKLYWNFIRSLHIDEEISRAIKGGSAVRRETGLRKDYEKEWRKDSLETWSKTYESLMENRDYNEVQEYERKFEKEKQGLY